MIISASRRTDVPAFLGKYFYESLIKGEFKIINPFNRKATYLKFNHSDIDGIVFWTKNPKPFFKYLKKLKEQDFRFYFHYTINNYPEKIEPNLAEITDRIEIFNELNELILPNKIVWRYDPIILTDNFNISFHKENFEYILQNIEKNVFKITVSLITIYKKNKRYFPDIELNRGKEAKILNELNLIARKYNKSITTCCYKINGIEQAKCIDGKIFNKSLNVKKHYGQRKDCNCDKSIDIGDYRTCRYKCIYCYAR
jgi:DNA repair photolyase